jgi:hypothetical protein
MKVISLNRAKWVRPTWGRAAWARVSWAIALLFGLCAGSGCKKSTSPGGGGGGTGSGYYMKFKLDGVQTEYDSEPIAGINYNSGEGLYSLVIAAYKDVYAGAKNEITIIGYSNTNFAINVAYNDPAKAIEKNGAPLPEMTVFYNDSSANGFLTAGEFADAAGNMLIPGMVANAKLTITELATSYIKGNFSGSTYKGSDFSKIHAITEGTFYLKRTQ